MRTAACSAQDKKADSMTADQLSQKARGLAALLIAGAGSAAGFTDAVESNSSAVAVTQLAFEDENFKRGMAFAPTASPMKMQAPQDVMTPHNDSAPGEPKKKRKKNFDLASEIIVCGQKFNDSIRSLTDDVQVAVDEAQQLLENTSDDADCFTGLRHLLESRMAFAVLWKAEAEAILVHLTSVCLHMYVCMHVSRAASASSPTSSIRYCSRGASAATASTKT